MSKIIGTVGPKTRTFSTMSWLPPINPQEVYRVVGYFEYRRALDLLDRLLGQVNSEELQVATDIVRSRPEFAIYTNLSRRIEGGPSTLSESAANSSDDFRRHGLDWMMALARVELGAMVAGFTTDTNPFDRVRPSNYEMAAYKELVEDGGRVHFWSLQNDPTLAQATRNRTLKANERQVIAYVRRASVAREFLKKAQALNYGRLSAGQSLELDSWDRQLTSLEHTLLYDVLGLGGSMTTSEIGPQEVQLAARSCSGVAALADLRNGKALVDGKKVAFDDLLAGKASPGGSSVTGQPKNPSNAGAGTAGGQVPNSPAGAGQPVTPPPTTAPAAPPAKIPLKR